MTVKDGTTECCRYEGDRGGLITRRSDKAKFVWTVAKAVLVTVAILALLFATVWGLFGGAGKRIGDLISEFSISNGFLFFENRKNEPPMPETGSEADVETESQSETLHTETEVTSETEECLTDTDPEQETETEKRDDVVTRDLSLAENGAGYLNNLTNVAIQTHLLLDRGFQGDVSAPDGAPQVLILHTHTSEAYWDADPQAEHHRILRGVVSVGEAIVSELNLRGVPAVHCTVIHDGASNRDSYEKAADTIETMLEIYPSVRYVIDLHRLAESDSSGLPIRTAAADGTAQLQLTVSDADAPFYDSLTLALCLRKALNEDGARLCMPVVLTDTLPNSQLSDYYMKIDVGGLGNTSEEAKQAGVRFAIALSELLKEN